MGGRVAMLRMASKTGSCMAPTEDAHSLMGGLALLFAPSGRAKMGGVGDGLWSPGQGIHPRTGRTAQNCYHSYNNTTTIIIIIITPDIH